MMDKILRHPYWSSITYIVGSFVSLFLIIKTNWVSYHEHKWVIFSLLLSLVCSVPMILGIKTYIGNKVKSNKAIDIVNKSNRNDEDKSHVISELRGKNMALIALAITSVILTVAMISISFMITRHYPIAALVTKINSFENGYFSGVQEHFFSSAGSNDLSNKLNIVYKTRNDSGMGEVSDYRTYVVTSNNVYSDLQPSTNKEHEIELPINSQYYINSKFRNTINVSEGGDWHNPIGWSGFNYKSKKIYPANELLIILDFRNIGIAHSTLFLSNPRYQVFQSIETKPSLYGGDEGDSIQNNFIEMKSVPGSKSLIWYANVKNPPSGWVLVRWKPFSNP